MSTPNKVFSLDETRQWFNSLAVRQSAGVIFRAGDEVFLVKPGYRNYWVWPGGMLNQGEAPEQAARREVREELGIEVGELKLAYSDVIPPHDGFLDSKSFCYQVDVSDKAAFLRSITLDTEEHEAAEFVSSQEAQQRFQLSRPVLSGILQGLGSSTCILRWALRSQRAPCTTGWT